MYYRTYILLDKIARSLFLYNDSRTPTDFKRLIDTKYHFVKVLIVKRAL